MACPNVPGKPLVGHFVCMVETGGVGECKQFHPLGCATKSSQNHHKCTSHEFGKPSQLASDERTSIYQDCTHILMRVVHECWAINEGISFHKEAVNSSGKLGWMQLPRPRKLENIHVVDTADKRNSIWTSCLLGIMDTLGLTLRLGHSKSRTKVGLKPSDHRLRLPAVCSSGARDWCLDCADNS